MAKKNIEGNNRKMSFTNFASTYFWLVVGIIFISTAILLAQIRGSSEQLFKPSSVRAFIWMNLIFAVIAFLFIIFIVAFVFLFNSEKFNLINGILSFPPSTPSAILGGFVMLFFTALFIGNAVYMKKLFDTVKEQPDLLPTSPGVAQAFWIINLILAIVSPLISFGLFFLAYYSARKKAVTVASKAAKSSTVPINSPKTSSLASQSLASPKTSLASSQANVDSLLKSLESSSLDSLFK